MGEPSMEEWEQAFGADLRPRLIPAGRPDAMRRPSGADQLPPGAHAALSAAVGRCSLQDLLIVPSAARSCGWLRHRFVYTPPCVLGAGDRAVALWVQAPPEPGIRALVPLGEIAAIALHTHGTSRQLVVTGSAGRLPVRYGVADDPVMDGLIIRLRRRVAGRPAPVPPVAARFAALLRLDPADEVATTGPKNSGSPSHWARSMRNWPLPVATRRPSPKIRAITCPGTAEGEIGSARGRPHQMNSLRPLRVVKAPG